MKSFVPTAETMGQTLDRSGLPTVLRAVPPKMPPQTLPSIRTIDAEPGRLERITVCTRPFRASGPRIEPERVGDKLIVHNYGHGGSGWSLSWGSADLVVPLVLAGGTPAVASRRVAVLGCGALGLTAALRLQDAGLQVAMYAREVPPDVRSSRATGLWSPDSRVALAAATDAPFAERWERMARGAWAAYATLLRSPGEPVAMHDRYELSDLPPSEAVAARHRADPIGFAHLEHRIADLYPPNMDFGPGEHPFPTQFCRQTSTLRFNITALSQQLLARFFARGGTLHRTELHTVAELAGLPEPVIVNCTGYGARALFGDETLTPVRGQIGWLPPQPEVNYSLQWGQLSVVGRADGIVVQMGAASDGMGWGDATEMPDRAEAEEAVRLLAHLQTDRIPRRS